MLLMGLHSDFCFMTWLSSPRPVPDPVKRSLGFPTDVFLKNIKDKAKSRVGFRPITENRKLICLRFHHDGVDCRGDYFDIGRITHNHLEDNIIIEGKENH